MHLSQTNVIQELRSNGVKGVRTIVQITKYLMICLYDDILISVKKSVLLSYTTTVFLCHITKIPYFCTRNRK